MLAAWSGNDWTLPAGCVPALGQSWAGSALSFLVMWIAMMAAMMLPSLAPILWRQRRAVGGRLVVAGAGYFFVWTAIGVAVFASRAALTAIELRWPMLLRLVPLAVATLVVVAGALQFTAWKTRHLACCHARPTKTDTAWRHGVRLGLHCSASSAGPTAILLAIGMMDLRAMAAVTAAVTVERLAPAGARVAQAIGALLVGTGLGLFAHAAGLG